MDRLEMLALRWGEKAEDILALAIKCVEIESERTIENLTHLAEACRSYNRTRPISDKQIVQTLTPEYIQQVLVPEICDNIAREYIGNLTYDIGRRVWEESHPSREEIPASVLAQIHALRCDDSQTWRESERKADKLKEEWMARTGQYQNQYTHCAGTMMALYKERIREDVRKRGYAFLMAQRESKEARE